MSIAFGTAFQVNAFQNNAYQTGAIAFVNIGDAIDYIFQFPDRGSYQRDPIIQAVIQTSLSLLNYNPVETLQPPLASSGNPLVVLPQQADSTVALPGFWGLVTTTVSTSQVISGALFNHPNVQIVNDRTLMRAGQPSVIEAKIDVSHIHIVVNSFGTYAKDGLILFPTLALTDDANTFLLSDNNGIVLVPG